MVTWKGLPWVVVVLIVSFGPPAVAAATKNPTCVTGCVAAFEYCELQAHVTEDKGIATCVTNATTTTPKGCSDLLTAAGKACPQPVTDAKACMQAVDAAAQCLHTCDEQLVTDTCEQAFSSCFKGC